MNAAEEREKEFWLLWNQLYKQVGPIRFEQLLRAFGSAEKAWKAPAKEFKKLGWGSKTLEILQNRDRLMVTTISGIISKHNILVLTREESGYPQGLLQIDAPPPVLYVRGEILPRDRLSLAVVGSRKMTRYGREVVEALVPELAAAGLTIVSGLALGIDTVAHRVALEAEGRTIAVLPCGMDQVYPLSNTSLAE